MCACVCECECVCVCVCREYVCVCYNNFHNFESSPPEGSGSGESVCDVTCSRHEECQMDFRSKNWTCVCKDGFNCNDMATSGMHKTLYSTVTCVYVTNTP